MRSINPISIVIKAYDDYSATFRKAVSGTEHITKRLQSFSKVMTLASLPVIAFGGYSVVAAKQFSESMANVSTLIPGQTKKINSLSDSVRALSKETGKSAVDISGGLYQVISAFGDTADTAKILEIATKSAKAGVAQTTEAVDLLAVVANSYGNTSATAVQKIADLSFQTVKLGKTTLPDLAGSIGEVAPLTKELGISMEELFGVMATSTLTTKNAAKAATQFKGVLQALMSPSDGMTQLLKHFGFESGKALIQQKGLKGAIDLIAWAAKRTKQPLQTFVGSIEGQTLVTSLAGASSKILTQRINEMGLAAGAAGEAYGEMTTGIGASAFEMDQAQQTLNDFAITVGNIVLPALASLAKIVTPIFHALSLLPKPIQTFLVSLVALAVVIGPIAYVIAKLIPIFTFLAAVVMSVVNAFALLAWLFPTIAFGWIAAGILAVITALVLLWRNWDTVWGAINTVFKGFVNLITGFVEGLPQWMDTFMLIFGPFVSLPLLLYKNWSRFISFIKPALSTLKGFFTGNENSPLAPRPQQANRRSVVDWTSGILNRATSPSDTSKSQAEVKVSFQNAPRGLRAETQSRGPMRLDTEMGYTFATP